MPSKIRLITSPTFIKHAQHQKIENETSYEIRLCIFQREV